MARRCPRCGASVGGFVEECPSCGQAVPVAMPWWGWVLGGALVLLLFLALGDLATLVQVLGRVLASFRAS